MINKKEIKAPCKLKIIPVGTLLVERHAYLLWDRMIIERSTVRSRLVPRSARKLKVRVKDRQENLQMNSSQVAGQSKQLNRNYTDRNTQSVKSPHAQQTRQKTERRSEWNECSTDMRYHPSPRKLRNLKHCSASASELCYVWLFTHSLFSYLVP